jgi:exosortase
MGNSAPRKDSGNRDMATMPPLVRCNRLPHAAAEGGIPVQSCRFLQVTHGHGVRAISRRFRILRHKPLHRTAGHPAFRPGTGLSMRYRLTDPAKPLTPLLILGGLLGCIVWSYWPLLCSMALKWSRDPQYSHAYLVPVFSAVLLWLRRGRLKATSASPCWWGLAVLLAGAAMRLVGARYYVDWFQAISLLPVLGGAALLLRGWPGLRWSWLAIGFLFFMVPLPYRLETGLSRPLQQIATVAATYALQTLGQPAVAEGNIIIVNQARIGVVEACSGLGMLLVFFALTTGVVMLIRRSLLDKVVLLLTTAPIAVLVNVIRITLTGVLYESAGSQWAELAFHDLAGWLMMPMALGLLCLELHVLSHLFVAAPVGRPVPSLTLDVAPLSNGSNGKRSRNRLERRVEHYRERKPTLGS